MADKTTLQETTLSPVSGAEWVRLATAGANWKAQITEFGRVKLQAATDYYVATAGNDTNDGSIGSPWLTLQRALDVLGNEIDFNGQNVIIHIGAGSFQGGVVRARAGGGILQIRGAGSGLTTLNQITANDYAFLVHAFTTTQIWINGVTLAVPTASGVSTCIFLQTLGAEVVFGDVGGNPVDLVFACGPGVSAFFVDRGILRVFPGAIAIQSTTPSANFTNAIKLQGGVLEDLATWTVSGTPNYTGTNSAFIYITDDSHYDGVSSGGFSGTATGLRYLGTQNSDFDINPATPPFLGNPYWFPGSVAGQIDNSSSYPGIFLELNVKTFGAIGDGVADDTVALQTALDTAFGSGGSIPQTAQRRVIIPPGTYLVSGGGLTGRNWNGGCIAGSGRFTTELQNISGGPIFTTNGCEYMRFEDMYLNGNGSTAVLFDLDWGGTGTALQSNTFINMYFANAAIGVRIAATGFMGSENLFVTCFWNNLSTAGLQVLAGNALQQTIIGGDFQACDKGIQITAGSVNAVISVGFQLSTTADISIEGSTTNNMVVLGCRTESSNFVVNAGQNMKIDGCQQQVASSRGLFYTGSGGAIDISSCYFQGQVEPKGWTRLYMHSCVADNEVIAGDWLIKNPGNWWFQPANTIPLVIELENIISFILSSPTPDSPIIGKQRLFTTDGLAVTTENYLEPPIITTFTSLPDPAVAIGTTAMITDCNSSTWGALAAGGGTIQAMLFADGANWYVMGVGSLTRIGTVKIDAVGTEQHVTGTTSATYTGITVGSGLDRALVVSLNFGIVGGTPPTGISVVWDSGGTNQAMTQIVSGANAAGQAELWGLVNPASGNKTLAVSWTNNAECFVVAVSFTEVLQTGGAVTFPNSAVQNVSATDPKITITSASRHMVMGTMLTGAAVGTLLGTQIYKDNGGAIVDAGATYQAGAATRDVGWTGGFTTALIAGTDIVPD